MQTIWNRNTSRVSIIIQARVGSTRFPNKVLADICGKTMLERVIDRVKMTGLRRIILAIPNIPSDRILASIAIKNGTKAFIGSENNVLDRYYYAATTYSCLDTIVRITADCPLIDPEIINKTIKFFLDEKLDYAANTGYYPDGMDTEVFKFEALDLAWENATSSYDKEHVTPYIINSGKFKVGYLKSDIIYPKIHWSIDYEKDLDFVRKVYSTLGDKFTLDDIVKLKEGENAKPT